MINYDGTIPSKTKTDSNSKRPDHPSSSDNDKISPPKAELAAKQNNDDNVFSDSEGEEETVPSRTSGGNTTSTMATSATESTSQGNKTASLSHQIEQLSLGSAGRGSTNPPAGGTSKETNFDASERSGTISSFGSGDIKAIAADASVFSFGDDEDFDSE